MGTAGRRRRLIYGAYITEVTVVREQVPVEPRARVALVYDADRELASGEVVNTRGVTRRAAVGRLLAVR